MNFLYATAPERRLLPARGIRGPVPFLIAIMTFVMVVVAAAGLSLANAASVVKSGVGNRYSIQIADGEQQAPAAIAAARAVPGVLRVAQVPPADLRRTLERWLGPAAAQADLPIPAMIDVDLRPGASAGAVSAAVRRAVPTAQFVAHASSLAPLLDALRGLVMLAFFLMLLVALASAAAVVLAARGALDNHRATIEVMHGVGATDEQITRLFQRQIAIDSLLGGLAGATAAGLVLAALLGGSDLAATLSSRPLLGWDDALVLALIPVVGALLATLVARRAVLGELRERL